MMGARNQSVLNVIAGALSMFAVDYPGPMAFSKLGCHGHGVFDVAVLRDERRELLTRPRPKDRKSVV